MKQIRIAVTPGEPAGIGPELVLKLAIQAHSVEWVAFADPDLLRTYIRLLDLPVQIQLVKPNMPPTPHIPGILKVYPMDMPESVVPGMPSPKNAMYVLETVKQATAFCLSQNFSALVTGPIHKGIINNAGISFTGHTEFLSTLCGSEDAVMMMATPTLKVALVTTHMPLRAVPNAITSQRLTHVIQVLGKQSKITVCGLNPHAGENGHLGQEEEIIIIPTIQKLQQEGFQLQGPFPADTVFTKTHLKNTDIVLAMYHDQGLPVLKSQGLDHVINVTLGLPIIRTSCGHGTALDLAGTGKASPASLQAALQYAINLLVVHPEPGRREETSSFPGYRGQATV